MPDQNEIAQLSARIEDLVKRIESIADPAVRTNVTALAQSLMEVHGRAVARLSELILEEGEAGRKILRKLAEDELVGGLLLLYGCHPETLEARVEKAVARMQELLSSSNASARLSGIENGLVRIHLTATVSGCGGGAGAFERTIEDCIYSTAPDVAGVEIESELRPEVRAGDLVQLQIGGHSPGEA